MSKIFFFIYDILFVMESKYRILKEYFKERLHSPYFYEFYINQKKDIKSISDSLNCKDENIIFKREYFSINSEILNLKADDIYFLLDILRGGKSFEKKIDSIFDFLDVNIQDIGELIFFFNPKKYPPVTGILRKKIKSIPDYYEWIKIAKNMTINFMDDYIMIHAALLFDETKINNKKIELLKELINNNSQRNQKSVLKIKKTIKNLNYFEKKELEKNIFISDYEKSVFFLDNIYTVIDGSNVIYSVGGKPDINNYLALIDKIKSLGFPLYPIETVFDENIKYILNSSQIKIFENIYRNSRVSLFSPADEKIISLARKHKGIIISRDNFSEYRIGNLKVIKPEDINESYRF